MAPGLLVFGEANLLVVLYVQGVFMQKKILRHYKKTFSHIYLYLKTFSMLKTEPHF